MPLPQGLCTGCSRCLECFAPLHDSLAPLRPPVLCANVISVRSILTILFKMANLIPEFRIIHIPIFSPQHLSPLMYYKIFLFLVSLPASLSLFPLFGSSQPVPLASHATYGSDLERELGCVLAAGLISICRLPPRGQGFLCLLFLDVFSSTWNSPCM